MMMSKLKMAMKRTQPAVTTPRQKLKQTQRRWVMSAPALVVAEEAMTTSVTASSHLEL